MVKSLITCVNFTLKTLFSLSCSLLKYFDTHCIVSVSVNSTETDSELSISQFLDQIEVFNLSDEALLVYHIYYYLL